jgi:hypothetical protein
VTSRWKSLLHAGGGKVEDHLIGHPRERFPGRGYNLTEGFTARLNESARGRVRTGEEQRDESGRDGLDLVRLHGCAQENKGKSPFYWVA